MTLRGRVLAAMIGLVMAAAPAGAQVAPVWTPPAPKASEPTAAQLDLDLGAAEGDLGRQAAAARTQQENMLKSIDGYIALLRLKVKRSTADNEKLAQYWAEYSLKREQQWAEYSRPLWVAPAPIPVATAAPDAK